MRCSLHSRNSDGLAPTCTVVICTRNRPEELERCLAALALVVYPDFDVLVVDNAPSDDRTRDIAERWEAGYVVEPIVGLSRARNRGARSCETEIVAFIDDDALPDPKWLDRLITEFKDPRVMVVTGRILPLCVETRAEDDCAMINGFSDQRRAVDRHTPSWFELANFGGLGDGGNMAFRRCAFDIWPGFDERLGRGAPLDGSEEHHAFFALVERGWRAVFTLDAVVRHPNPATVENLRARHLKDLSASTAYLVLLFVEHPRYRRRTLRYAAQALAGVRRPWRVQPPEPTPRITPRWRTLLACISGPFLYVRSRFAHAAPAYSPFTAEIDGTPVWTPHAPMSPPSALVASPEEASSLQSNH